MVVNEDASVDATAQVYTENVGRDKIIMDMDVAYAGDLEFVVSCGMFKGGINNMQVAFLFRDV